MKELWKRYGWIVMILVGSALYSAGFSWFLEPNSISPGGISGLALVVVRSVGFGQVGMLTILINLPLFIIGGMKVGKRFFWGSLIGMNSSSIFIDLMALVHVPALDPMLAVIYGGVTCGIGLGMVFIWGGSTGGTDIMARLLKLKYNNVPIGQIAIVLDGVVALLTGIVLQDFSKTLYTALAVYICGKAVDMVVYRFDYSNVALIISSQYEVIAKQIGQKLDRGATFLHGEGSYTHQGTKVVLAAVKKRQITELKELVTELDPNAFVIVQEAHQVLGDGFSRYNKNAL